MINHITWEIDHKTPLEVKDYKALEQITKSFEKKIGKIDIYNLE
jgi:hypothetical protein